jgi:hypothetical protein
MSIRFLRECLGEQKVTEIVQRAAFKEAVAKHEKQWLFTIIVDPPKLVCQALALGAATKPLIISVETAIKNLKKHPELKSLDRLFTIAAAAVGSEEIELIGSGARAIQLFFKFETTLWELVIKRSSSDEAICTSIHRADLKRLLTSRRKGRTLGEFQF